MDVIIVAGDVVVVVLVLVVVVVVVVAVVVSVVLARMLATKQARYASMWWQERNVFSPKLFALSRCTTTAVDMVVSISRSVTLHDEGCQPWTLRGVQDVGGMEFVMLAAADKSFCRFVQSDFGTAQSRRSLQPGASALLNKWQALRTTATLDHVVAHSAAFSSLFDDRLPTEQHKKRARRESTRQELPDAVEIELPEYDDHTGTSFGPRRVKMRPSIVLGSNLWIELTVDNIAFAKGALRMAIGDDAEAQPATNHECDGRPMEQLAGGYVKWRAERQAWRAVRGTKPGKGNTKHFRVADVDCELQMREAHDAAKRWAEGDESMSNGDVPAPCGDGGPAPHEPLPGHLPDALVGAASVEQPDDHDTQQSD